jgi:nucleoside-diphosphate-sugar epimerase
LDSYAKLSILAGMKVGITGHRGVLGQLLVKAIKGVDCFDGDVRNQRDLERWLDGKVFDALFHLAAVVPVSEVQEDPFRAYEVNVGGTLNLLSALNRSVMDPWIFYASSSHVYQSSSKPLSEEDAIEPQNLYGQTKYLGEQVCTAYQQSYGSRVCIGRIFSFYHETQKPPFLYPSLMKRFEKEDLSKPFFLRGAESERDIQNAEQVIEKALLLMNRNYSGVVNIGTGKGIKIREFVQSIAPSNLNITAYEDDIASSLSANVSKFKKVTSESLYCHSHI